MSLGHINEISSVGNLSSVNKSRRSSIASLPDLGINTKEFLDEINLKIGKEQKKVALKNRPARSYSDTVTRHQVEEELKVAGRLDSASSNTGAEAENNDSLGRTQSGRSHGAPGMREVHRG